MPATATELKTASDRIRARVVLDLIRAGEIIVHPRCAHCSARSIRREPVMDRPGNQFRCLSCGRVTKTEDAHKIRQEEIKTMTEGRNLNRGQRQMVERRVQRLMFARAMRRAT